MPIVEKATLMQEAYRPKFKVLLNGGFGYGKTYKAMTFRKWAYAMIEPHGILTARTNPHLLENMVYYQPFLLDVDFAKEFDPTKPLPKACPVDCPPDCEVRQKIKVIFGELETFLHRVKQDALAGTVETCIVDNLTHLLWLRWVYICHFEKNYAKSGELNTLAMYGGLARWAELFALRLNALPCHVVLTAHIEEEEEEVEGKKVKTGKWITDTLGSFRSKAGGLFNANLYLDIKREQVGGKTVYKYLAYCLPTGKVDAKNNLGLPEVVEDISYDKLVAALPTLDGESR